MRQGFFGAMVALLLVAGCGQAAGSAAGTAAGGAPAKPAGGAASAPASAAPAPADYRQQVIEAARAEGEVNATIQTTFTPETIQKLEAAIEREYGVKIKVNFTPVGNYLTRSAELLTEEQANATPSYDLYQSSDTTSATLYRAGALQEVNWAPLLPAGTPPAMVPANGAHLVTYTDHFGLMSDPNTIADADVPRSLKDLANPRWRGKVMMFSGGAIYIAWVLQLGREETLAALRAAVQNGAVVDTIPNEFTRFAAKEYPMVIVTGSFHTTAQLRGIPSRFTPLDVSLNNDHHVSVARRAVHPNAAKLLAAVLAGPEGQRISAESVGVGSRYYPGSADDKLEQEARAAGFPSFSWRDNPDLLAYALSPEADELSREIDRIFKGG